MLGRSSKEWVNILFGNGNDSDNVFFYDFEVRIGFFL